MYGRGVRIHFTFIRTDTDYTRRSGSARPEPTIKRSESRTVAVNTSLPPRPSLPEVCATPIHERVLAEPPRRRPRLKALPRGLVPASHLYSSENS